MSSLLARRALICHRDTPCAALVALGASIRLRADHGWDVAFVAVGDPGAIIVPPPADAVPTDGLWRSTCFELFFARTGDSYSELNLSPSGAFAAYHFEHYRTGMRPIAVPPPAIAMTVERDRLTLRAHLSEDALPWDGAGQLGLCAVIREKTGATSYWALAHAPGKPDFHHRDCFALRLPAQDGS